MPLLQRLPRFPCLLAASRSWCVESGSHLARVRVINENGDAEVRAATGGLNGRAVRAQLPPVVKRSEKERIPVAMALVF